MDPRSFIGKRLDDQAIPTPAAVLDRAVVQRNCGRMLAAVEAMHLSWRAHIKTHKTIELTRLQVGNERPVRIIVSTMLEAERVLPLLQSYQAAGRAVNILYGFPLYASAVARLAVVARALGRPGAVSVLVDHEDQVVVAQALAHEAATTISVFVKIDMGTTRAGVVLGSDQCSAVLRRLLSAHTEGESGSAAGARILFYGLYCHAGESYDARAPWAAMAHLVKEFEALGAAAAEVRRVAQQVLPSNGAAATESLRLVLSVGASPTAATLQHPDLGGGGSSNGVSEMSDGAAASAHHNAAALRATLRDLEAQGCELEVHAGVQPVMDLQQLATHSWRAAGAAFGAAAEIDNLALTIMADVASVYPGRGAQQQSDEVLVNAGCLALGREPVKDAALPHGRTADEPVYAGWGIVQPWPAGSAVFASEAMNHMAVPDAEFPRLSPTGAGKGWWQIGRVSQEHGILTWAGGRLSLWPSTLTPQPGQRLRIWPNHACIAGAGFDYYLVVDSSSNDPDEVKDVWLRWNGW